MARALRLEFEGALYHLCARGNRRDLARLAQERAHLARDRRNVSGTGLRGAEPASSSDSKAGRNGYEIKESIYNIECLDTAPIKIKIKLLKPICRIGTFDALY